MSQTLLHSTPYISLSSPFCSKTPLNHSRIFLSSSPNRNNCIKAKTGENRDTNLDHLQRASKQPQPKRKSSPIGLWDRYPTARTVQQMMDIMMDDPIGYSKGRAFPYLPRESNDFDNGGYSRGRSPWEIKERESDYKMRFDMPGMTKEDVKVWVEEKMLVVKAEKMKKNEEKEEEEWSAQSYGKYSCRIGLPENIQFENIKAEVKDGVLYVCVPKASSPSKVLDINVQ